MIRIPAHHQWDPAKKPGQVVYPLANQWPNKTTGSIVTEVTLNDYIARKEKQYKDRMTFEQWFAQYNKENGLPPANVVAKAAWKAAQENM